MAYQLINIENLIKKVVLQYVDPNETYIFLFGSRAMGTNQKNSDYDIGIYKGQKIPLKTIALIKDQLEDYPIPVHVDIIDFFSVTNEFKKLASRKIKIWNKPKKDLTRNFPF